MFSQYGDNNKEDCKYEQASRKSLILIVLMEEVKVGVYLLEVNCEDRMLREIRKKGVNIN